MAGHARYTALLDACVLHPMTTADALMSLASAGLYAAKWSRTIEAEWIA
jgi:hydrogenase/urease accessory protein HupE